MTKLTSLHKTKKPNDIFSCGCLATLPSRALQQTDRAINNVSTTTLARIEQHTAHSEPIPVAGFFSGVVQGRPAKISCGQPVGPPTYI